MIINGYAGIGKSWIGRHMPNAIDLESTPFEKDWDRYLKCIGHFHRQGYLVMVSYHPEIRRLVTEHFGFSERMSVLPDPKDKELYRKKYTERGNTPEFIKTQMDNWDEWTDWNKNCVIGENQKRMLPGENLFEFLLRIGRPQFAWMFCTADNYCQATGCHPDGSRNTDMDCPYTLPCVNPIVEVIKHWPLCFQSNCKAKSSGSDTDEINGDKA